MEPRRAGVPVAEPQQDHSPSQVVKRFVGLPWSTTTVGRFLAARYGGRAEAVPVEIGLALATVAEWFPVRPIVA